MQTKRSTINATETFPANNVIVQCVNDCTEFVLSSLAQCSDQTCQEFLDPSWSDTEESLTAPRQHRQRRRRQRCQQRRVRNNKEDGPETVTTTSIRSQGQQRGLDAPGGDRDDKVPLTEYDRDENYNYYHTQDQSKLSKTTSRSLIVNPNRSEPDITNHHVKDHVTEEGGYSEELTDEERDDLRSTRFQSTMSRTNNNLSSGDGDSGGVNRSNDVGTDSLPKIHPTTTIMASTGNSPSEEKYQIIRTSFWPTHHPTSFQSNECKRGYTEQTDTPIENAVDMTCRSIEMKSARFYHDNSNESIASDTWSLPSKPASLQDDTSYQSLVNKNFNGNVELDNPTTRLQHYEDQARFQQDDISIESFFSDTSSSNSNSINIWKRERLKTALQKFLEDKSSSIESTSSLSIEDRQDSPSVDRYHV
jgi:hypothetical protein